MSFNLGSEHSQPMPNDPHRLTPMSFSLGSEQTIRYLNHISGLTPMSFSLGSEPLFSNPYLIVT